MILEDEVLGQDDLSMVHAAKQGVHDAVAQTIKLGALGLIFILAFGPETIRKILKKVL